MSLLKRYLMGAPAPLSMIVVLLVFGVGCVGFGNADRLLHAAMTRGGTLQGIVLDVRSYAPAGASQLAYVPRVAFRDGEGQVHIREAISAPLPFVLEADQPVRVLWDEARDQIAVDLVIQRGTLTGWLMSGLTGLGLLAWFGAVWLLGRRVWLAPPLRPTN